MHSRSKRSVRLRALAAGLCLLAYLQAAGFGPFLLGLAASVEGSHVVSIACASDEVAVILHHKDCCKARLGAHCHGAASRLICLFETSRPTPLTDHVASFAGNSSCEPMGDEFKAKKAESLHSSSFAPAAIFDELVPPALQPIIPTLDLPSASMFVNNLRTTVLRI